MGGGFWNEVCGGYGADGNSGLMSDSYGFVRCALNQEQESVVRHHLHPLLLLHFIRWIWWLWV